MLEKINLDALEVDFHVDRIIDIAFELFPPVVWIKEGKIEVEGQHFDMAYHFYSPIEDAVFDTRKSAIDPIRADFYETLEIASWAVFRVLSKAIKSKMDGGGRIELSCLDKDEMRKLFLYNMDNGEFEDLDEGRLMSRLIL